MVLYGKIYLLLKIYLIFTSKPTFDRKSGFYLGNNSLIGPLSNMTKIDIQGNFTIFVVLKNGKLVSNTQNDYISILKMFANSPNNNGLSFYIDKGSLKSNNNIEQGSLMFQFSNLQPQKCLINSNHDTFSFEQNTLSFYFIVKQQNQIKIIYINEKNNTLYQLLNITVAPNNINFSNKELIINQFNNFNASIYNYGIYSNALDNEEISNVYKHILQEYLKNTNNDYQFIIKKYNNITNNLENIKKCPYNKNICDNCNEVTNWNDFQSIVNASDNCKKSIHDFCNVNKNNPLCKCYNNNSKSCQLYKSILSNNNITSDIIDKNELELIKKKYNLIDKNACPKNICVVENSPKKDSINNEHNILKIKYPELSDNNTSLKKQVAQQAMRKHFVNKKINKKNIIKNSIFVPELPKTKWRNIKKNNSNVKNNPNIKNNFSVINYFKNLF